MPRWVFKMKPTEIPESEPVGSIVGIDSQGNEHEADLYYSSALSNNESLPLIPVEYDESENVITGVEARYTTEPNDQGLQYHEFLASVGAVDWYVKAYDQMGSGIVAIPLPGQRTKVGKFRSNESLQAVIPGVTTLIFSTQAGVEYEIGEGA